MRLLQAVHLSAGGLTLSTGKDDLPKAGPCI